MNNKFIAIFIISLLFSCEWEPFEIYENELRENPNPPEIEMVEFSLSLSQDTVVLQHNLITFDFSSSDQKIHWVNFILNGKEIGKVEKSKGTFILRNTDWDKNLYDGYHTLKIELFTSSGSGSIADQIKVEGFLFESKEWKIKVLFDYESDLVLTDEYNGFLRFRWLNKDNSSVYFYAFNHELGNSNTGEFIYKGYIGENIDIEFRKENDFGSQYRIGNVVLPNEIPRTEHYIENGKYFIRWNRPKYYSAIDKILIKDWSHLNNDTVEIYFGPDEFFHLELKNALLGEKRNNLLRLIPKFDNILNSEKPINNVLFTSLFYSFNIYTIGSPSFPFLDFYSVSRSTIIYSKPDILGLSSSIYKYDVKDNIVIDKLESFNSTETLNYYFSHLYVSPNGKVFSTRLNSSSPSVLVASGEDFKDFKICTITNMMSDLGKMPISDNGAGLIPKTEGLALFDFIKETDLELIKFPSHLKPVKEFHTTNISSNAKYFSYFRDDDALFFKRNDNEVLTVTKLNRFENSPYFDFFNYFPNDQEKFIGWDKTLQRVFIGNSNDLSNEKSFQLIADHIIHADFLENRLVAYSQNRLLVFSMDSGNLLYEIPYKPWDNWPKYDIKLHDNVLYLSGGLQYKLINLPV